jgi:hypothetical protein
MVQGDKLFRVVEPAGKRSLCNHYRPHEERQLPG